MDLVEIRVANRIQSMRQDKNFTLNDLAGRSNLSVPYLSRIENYKAGVPIANLARIAEALRIPISALFDEDAQQMPIIVSRSGKCRILSRNGVPNFELPAGAKRGKLMEPMVINEVGLTDKTPLRTHSGEEFIYILCGECKLRFGKESIDLKEGDSVYFDAQIPHACSQQKKGNCRAIVVVSSRDYVFHGDIDKLLNMDGVE